MAVTKADIAERLADKYGLNKREAKDMVDLFYEEVIHAIVKHGKLKLSGFGNFITRDKSSRPGRNPKTGEEVEISARRVVIFHAGQKLKARVEQYAGSGSSENQQANQAASDSE